MPSPNPGDNSGSGSDYPSGVPGGLGPDYFSGGQPSGDPTSAASDPNSSLVQAAPGRLGDILGYVGGCLRLSSSLAVNCLRNCHISRRRVRCGFPGCFSGVREREDLRRASAKTQTEALPKGSKKYFAIWRDRLPTATDHQVRVIAHLFKDADQWIVPSRFIPGEHPSKHQFATAYHAEGWILPALNHQLSNTGRNNRFEYFCIEAGCGWRRFAWRWFETAPNKAIAIAEKTRIVAS